MLRLPLPCACPRPALSPGPLTDTLLRLAGRFRRMPARILAEPRAAARWSHDDTPRSGWRDLDAAAPLKAGALTLADHDGAGAEILYAYMADAAVLGRTVLVADGGNFLDVYRLAAAARRRTAARFPDVPRSEAAAFETLALERVRLARGFTAHQLQSIVEDHLPREAAAQDDVGLVVAPGLADMYLDGELSRDEARTLVTRALSALRRLAARHAVPVVVGNAHLAPTSDHPLRVLLEESVDEQLLAQRAQGGGLHLRLPRRGAAFLAPAPGRTRLEDFADDAAYATPVVRARKPGAWVAAGGRMMGKFGERWRREPWAVLEAREAA